MCGVSTLEYFKEFFKAAIKREQFRMYSRNVERELAQVNLKAIMQGRIDYENMRIAEVREYDYDLVNKDIEELVDMAKRYDNMVTVKKMKEIVPEYKSNNSLYEVLDK